MTKGDPRVAFVMVSAGPRGAGVRGAVSAPRDDASVPARPRPPASISIMLPGSGTALTSSETDGHADRLDAAARIEHLDGKEHVGVAAVAIEVGEVVVTAAGRRERQTAERHVGRCGAERLSELA